MEAEILKPLGAEVRVLRWGGDRARLLELLDGLDIVMVLGDISRALDAEAIGRLREGGGIVRYGVGIDTIDLEAAKQRGIKVANIPDYGADIEVADHAAALTLSLVRRIVTRDAQVKADNGTSPSRNRCIASPTPRSACAASARLPAPIFSACEASASATS